MLNPMMGQLGMMGGIGKAKQILSSLRTMGNPQALLNKEISQNPQLKSVIDECGGDYQAAFYKLAEMRGVNPNDILDAFR